MSKAIRILSPLALAVAVVIAMPSPAFAVCGDTQPLQHILGNFFYNCPDFRPVQGYAYVLGQESVLNTQSTASVTGTIDIVCEDGTLPTQQGSACQPEAGVPGDGIVTVSFDWGGPLQTNGGACPNAAGVPGIGRNVVQVMANDGGQILVTVGYSMDYAGYILEMAHQGDGFSPIFCNHNNGLILTSSGLANTICIAHSTPTLFSDCDAGSLGAGEGNTCRGDIPSIAPGNLYTLVARCSAGIPDLRRSLWQPLPTTPGPNGSKCGVLPKPNPGGDCVFIGGSSIIGGTETDVLTGFIRPCCIAAVDKVAIRNVELRQGRLRVDFFTEEEATIVGFHVYAGPSRLNAGLIVAQGQGSNDYSFETGRGALRNERSITVEAMLSDGTSVRSDAVSVK